MLKLLYSVEFADVQFQVGDKVIAAHKIILASRAPTLAELVEDSSDTVLVLDGIDESIFQMILRFIYGDEIPPQDVIKKHAHELLNQANRFYCTKIKMIVEEEIQAIK